MVGQVGDDLVRGWLSCFGPLLERGERVPAGRERRRAEVGVVRPGDDVVPQERTGLPGAQQVADPLVVVARREGRDQFVRGAVEQDQLPAGAGERAQVRIVPILHCGQ